MYVPLTVFLGGFWSDNDYDPPTPFPFPPSPPPPLFNTLICSKVSEHLLVKIHKEKNFEELA